MEKDKSTHNLDEVLKAAGAVCHDSSADVFLYNGTITRNNVLSVMEELQKNKSRSKLFLLMVTYGGDPHAAFKISRYIQDHYDHFTLFVSGFCKSAGTLFAIAANEVVFTPFGELGPLDVQMAKPDQFQFDSGLVIGESLDTLERRASETFKRMFGEIMLEQQGLISVTSALHAASELTKSVYAPIMGRVDPEEVGVRQRALRIALDYGRRLAIKSQNTKSHTVQMLAEKYSSHSFVIDKQEAASLFSNVRMASEAEMELCVALGATARIEQSDSRGPTFTVLSKPAKISEVNKIRNGTDEAAYRSGNQPPVGRDTGGTNGSPVSASKQPPRKRRRGVRSADAEDGQTQST